MFVLHRLQDPGLDHRAPLKATGLSDAFGKVAELIMGEVVTAPEFLRPQGPVSSTMPILWL
jgi:leucyl aminopeptidase (aminopeptidase T)